MSKNASPQRTNNRYRVVQPIRRQKDGQEPQVFWQRLGTAFENEPKGNSFPTISIKLDALPLGGELVLFPDEDRGDRAERPDRADRADQFEE